MTPIFSGIKRFYEKRLNLFTIMTLIILVLAIGQVVYQQTTTGSFLIKDISLRGGITLTISSDAKVNTDDFEKFLTQNFPNNDFAVRVLEESGKQVGIIVDATLIPEESDKLIEVIESKFGKIPSDKYNIDIMGSALGASFFQETLRALIIAFILMGIVVFIYFRVPIPALVVILCAFSDMIVTLAVVNLLGIKVSTAGIAAFLMLIGYSVDTDILLSTHVLKREGKPIERIFRAMKTGFMTTGTTMFAVGLALIVTNSTVIREITSIVFIGLCVDLFYTWIQNAGVLKIYMERKHNEKD